MLSGLIGKLVSAVATLLPKLSYSYTGVDLDLNYSNVSAIHVKDTYKQTCTTLSCSFFWEEPLEVASGMTIKLWGFDWDVLSMNVTPGLKNLYDIIAVPKGAARTCSTPLASSSVVVSVIKGVPAPGRFTATKFSPAVKGDVLSNLLMRVNRSNFEENFEKPYNAPFVYIGHDGVICRTWKGMAASASKVNLVTPLQSEYRIIVQEGYNAFQSMHAPHCWAVQDYLQQLFSGFIQMESNFPLAFCGAYQFESVSPMLNSVGKVILIEQEYIQVGGPDLPFRQTLGVLRQ